MQNCLRYACTKFQSCKTCDGSSVGKTLSWITKLVSITLCFFTVFYISNESPDSWMHFARKISLNGAELPKLCLHQVGSVVTIIRLDEKLDRVILFFFAVFYTPNESPNSRVHDAKRISQNGAEMPKLCLYQVSELWCHCDDGIPNAEIHQQQPQWTGKCIIFMGVNLTYL